MDVKSLFRILSNLKVQKNASFGKLTDPTETVDVEGNIAVTGTVDGVDVSDLATTVSGKAEETITITAGDGLAGGGDLTADFTITNSDKGSDQNIFKGVLVSGQDEVSAGSNDDNITLTSSNGLTLTATAATNTIDFSVDDEITFDAVNFDTAANETAAAGKLFWDSTYGVLRLGLEGGNSVGLGSSSVIKVVNTSASTISVNQVVSVNDVSNNLPGVVVFADAAEGLPVLGITTEEILAGESGYVQTEGILSGVDTSGSTSGALLYVDTTTSQLTAVTPTAPEPQNIAGFVVTADVSGSAYIEFDRGRDALTDLEDVDSTITPSNGDVLVYNSTTSLWEPAVGTPKSETLDDGTNVVTAEEVRNHIDDTNNPHSLTTDVITEGATNKFYDSSLTNADIDARVDTTFVNNLNVDAGTVDGNNASDLLNRENHTGTQTTSTISDFSTSVQGEVNKPYVDGLNVDADTLDGNDATAFVLQSEVGAADGVASLGADGKIPSSELPALSLSDIFVVADNIERDGLTVQSGDIAQVTSTGLTFIYDGTQWLELTASSDVTSVNTQTGNVTLDTDDISEGAINKYYDSALFDTDFSGKTTDDLTEGTTNQYYSSTLANADIDTRVTKAFVDALNVDADTVDGLDSSAFSQVGHTHESSDITDFSTAVQNEVDKVYVDSLNVDADTLDGKDSTDFSEVGHTHTASEVTDFSTAVQTEVDKTYVDSLNIDASTLNGQNSSDFAEAGHTHTASDITDFSTAVQNEVDKVYVDSLNVDADTLDGNDSTAFVLQSEVGSADGVAPLDSFGLIDASYIPDSSKVSVSQVADLTARDALTVESGDVAQVASNGLTYIYDGTAWQEITSASAVTSVNSSAGNVVLTTDDIDEGTTNQYYSSTLANADIDTRVDKTFVDALNVDADTLNGNDSTDFATSAQGSLADTAVQPGDDVETLGSGAATENQAALADGSGNINWTSLDTSLVPEDAGQTNLYYTSARFDTDFSGKTTTDLTEGDNLYYTDARVRTEVEGSNLDLGSNTFTTTGTAFYANSFETLADLPDATLYPGMSAYVASEDSLYSSNGDAWFSVLDDESATTDDISEGLSNLYFTDARVNTAIDTRVTPSYIQSRVFSDSATNLYVDANLGNDSTNDGLTPNRPLATIEKAVTEANDMLAVAANDPGSNVTGVTIKVAAGDYSENNPITLSSRVSIVGDDLRNVRLFAQNPKADFFHVNSLNFLFGLRFIDLERPAFCVAFPSATADAILALDENDTIDRIDLIYAPVGYDPPGDPGALAPTIYIDPPDIELGDAVETIVITDGGSGYDLNNPPAVTISGGGGSGATAEAVVTLDAVTSINVTNGGSGYTSLPTVTIDPPASGTQATATSLLDGGVQARAIADVDAAGNLDGVVITDPGVGYLNPPHVSIAPPADKQAFITGSPYIQNCSSITGPFDINGKKIPVTVPLPYDAENGFTFDGETYSEVDHYGAGAGMRIDGRVCYGYNELTDGLPTINQRSPLRSMVADAFTQVNQGGPGHLITNVGYAQFVSCFTTFCTYSFKAKNGGFANISNSVTDFGDFGLIAEGFEPEFYTSGQSTETLTSTVSGINVLNGGDGYDSANPPNVTISGGGGSNATANAQVDDDGTVVSIVVDNPGSGYTDFPTVTIDPPASGQTASAEAVLSGVGTVNIDNIFVESVTGAPRRPDIGSVAFLEDGTNVRITNVVEETADPTFRVSFFPAVPSIANDETLIFHQLSNLSTGSHVFEYAGSGVTYNSLPFYGGVPDPSREVRESIPGKVYFSSTDNFGNFKVGPFFSVEQATGAVTIDSDQFNLSGLNAVGPFQVNGVTFGVQLREVTNNTDLVADSGLNGNAVPTVFAVREYVDNTVDKDFVDALNVDADTLDSLDSTDFAQLAANNNFQGSVVVSDDFTAEGNDIIVTGTNSVSITAGNFLDLDGPTSITGNTDITGTLDVTSNFSFLGITDDASDTVLDIVSSGDATFNYDLTVSGDFTVNGTTTTISSENLAVSNTLLLLNENQPTPLNDTGVLLQRYETTSATDFNVGIVWEEGQDELIFGFTQNDASNSEVTFDSEWLTLTSTGNAIVLNDIEAGNNITATNDITAQNDLNVNNTLTTNNQTINGTLTVDTVNSSGTVTTFNDDVTINGTMTATSIVESSSMSLKENITPLENPINKLMKLEPVMYDRIDGSKNNEIGLIAEQVAEVMPELVEFNEFGKPVGIQYTKLSVVLLHALKGVLDGSTK